MASKAAQLQRIKEVYQAGGNIIAHLKQLGNSSENTDEDIMISYDFQAGSYVQQYEKSPSHLDKYANLLAVLLESYGLGAEFSLVEVGVGEATTLTLLLKRLKEKPAVTFGFDIAWSRIKVGNAFLKQHGEVACLVTGTLFDMPFSDSSIDIVYTSHSLEPNGGREKEALEELYRVAKRYVVLLEPAYELASEEVRARMRLHGYVTHLIESAKELGYKIIEHRLFGISANPLNPTGLIVIEKHVVVKSDPSEPILVCPVTKKPLYRANGGYYCKSSLLVYPEIGGIPCLLPQNAVVATRFLDE